MDSKTSTQNQFEQPVNQFAPSSPSPEVQTINNGVQQQQSAKTDRIRLLLYSNTRLVGGMEEHIELIARHVDRSKFEVFAICPSMESVQPHRESLIRYSDHFAGITFDHEHPGNFPKLVQQIHDWRIDVMHMHNGYYRGQMLSYFAARLAGVQRVYVTEHLVPQQPELAHHTLMRNWFVRSIDGLICVSQKNYQGRAKFLYTPPDRTHIVENGIDTDDFQEIPQALLTSLRQQYQIPQDAQIIGTLVRFEPEKGLSYLIDAMAQIRAACPRAHLLMVGDGSLREELAAQAAHLGISEYVHFVGFQTEPRPYLGLMDVFALPVPVGSMSIALLEAMAMRRAVVMTFGGEGEAVVHGQTGLCAEPRNPTALADAIISILQSDTLRLKLGNAARQHVEDHFSAATTARKLEKLYSRL
ncbi:MAG: glycosyltransferase family 4 protein [Roseiflexaceae bacterium]|nr:glycosyltransferase family 4 protein [Roseiflexaceae bacterium]